MCLNLEFRVHTCTVECNCRVALAPPCCFSSVKLLITPGIHILLPLSHSHCCDNPELTALLHLHRQVASSLSLSPNPALYTSQPFLFLPFPSFSSPPFLLHFLYHGPPLLPQPSPLQCSRFSGTSPSATDLLECLFPVREGILVFLAITASNGSIPPPSPQN